MKVVINPAYSFLSDFINNLPDCFESDGDVIYKGRNTIKVYSVNGVNIAVKSFKIPLFVNRIAYTCFRKSKAARSFIHACKIKQLGFHTPEPISYIETFSGNLLKHSFFLSVYDSESETVRSLMAGEDKLDSTNKLFRFACFTAKLHQAGVYHFDYSPGNILIKNLPNNDYQFSLIDINRMKFKHVTKVDAYNNMSRLSSCSSVLYEIAKQYAICRGWNINETERNMTARSNRYFENYAFRLAWKSLKKSGCTFWCNPILKYKICIWSSKLPIFTAAYKKKLLQKEQMLYKEYIAQYDFRKVLSDRYVNL